MGNIKIHLKFGKGFMVEEKLYFFNLTFNGIFYVDITDLSIHFVDKFFTEKESTTFLSSEGGVVFNDAIYFLPNETNGILKYNFVTGSQQFIDINNMQTKIFDGADIICLQNKAYLFPYKLNKGIYVLDLQLENIEKHMELSSFFPSDIGINIFPTHDNCVLVGIYDSNKFVEIDLETKKIVCTEILQEDIKISGVCFDGSNYWILQTESTDIYEWNRESGVLQKYINENVEWERNIEYRIPYSNMIFLEDEVLVLNYSLKNILHINKSKKVIDEPIFFPKEFQLVNAAFCGWAICRDFIILENMVLIYPCRGNMLLVYDKVTKQLSGKEMTASEDEIPFLKKMINQLFLEKKPYIEVSEEFGTLVHFIEAIESDIVKEPVFNFGNIGKLIYQKC